MTHRRTVDICNARGLHARASAKFVKLASTFDAEVTVSRDEQSVGMVRRWAMVRDRLLA